MAPIFGIYRFFEGPVHTFAQTGMGRFPNTVLIANLLTEALKVDPYFLNTVSCVSYCAVPAKRPDAEGELSVLPCPAHYLRDLAKRSTNSSGRML